MINNMEQINCRDCDKEIKATEDEQTKELVLDGGKLLKYKHNGEDLHAYKCDECYAKDPSLTNFQKCEVYSRVVGYIRPVQQWNKGKQAEYADRVVYKQDEKNEEKK